MTAVDVTKQLRITEIFYSIQGETTLTGLPTIFIRLTGCPLRCQYCDTAYAFKGGELISLQSILEKISTYQTKRVCVTGGEPLAQPEVYSLLTLLCDNSYSISLETSGAMSIADVDPRVIKILDIKTPGSEESAKNHLDNLHYLNAHDQIKFVICDEHDYEFSKQFISDYHLIGKFEILFSPSYQQLSATTLAEWILSDQLPVRLQIQLHKMLWDDQPGH